MVDYTLRRPSAEPQKPRIGILRHDALVNPLPPIHRVISEVEQKLQSAGIEIITLDHRISQILGATAMLVNQFFAAPDNAHHFSLLQQTGEPLIPWLGPRLRKREAVSLEHLRSLFAHKGNVQQAFLDKVWKDEKVDAIICPVAPHPVPPLDRWGTANYTAPWVLFDYPAASLPVRKMEKEDLEEEVEGEPWDRERARSRPDEENRKLWNRDTINREDYLGSPLGLQVVAPRFQERKLWDVMTVIKDVLGKGTEMMGSKL